jgi:hypothetical protein
MATKKNSLFTNQLITKQDLEEFKNALIAEIKEISNHNPQPQKWIRSAEVRTMMNISSGTLQALRINGTLPFTKIGSIHYYNHEEVIKIFKS